MSRPALKLAIGVLGSLLVAWLARGHSRAAAIDEWLMDHPPEARIWEHALASRGLARCREPAQVHRALRTLPANVDGLHEAWCASECQWVAIAHGREELSLYSRNCRKPPVEGWGPRGRGWAAFPEVLTDVSRLAAAPDPAVPRAPAGDPREIRY